MSLMMSISGVRGLIGRTMTPVLAAELGQAFGAHVAAGRVVVGRDSRPSGPMVRDAVVAGLLASGCEVIDLGVASTPGVGLMVTRLGAAGGVVITASHNPIEWNGVKFITARGCAPAPDEAQRILDRYHAKRFELRPVEALRTARSDDSTHAEHVAAVRTQVNVDAIRRRKFRVVLDSVNGAGGEEGRRLLEQLGCSIEHLNGEPTGRFAHTPEPIAENLTGLCDAVRRGSAEIGFAQDPDADRLALVDERGQYIGEEFTLALAARRVFARRPGAAAANLSTSRMIDDLAAAAGGDCRVVRTPVGEAHVVQAMLREQCVIGGEGNGGVILPQVGLIRNSLVAMALVLDLLADSGGTLSAAVAALPRYAMVKRKFELPADAIRAWLERARAQLTDGRVNAADGLRIDWSAGWVHLRASNTEPIARAIAEAADAATAERLIERVAALRS
ncbi:MAG: phosphoglucosamine mutase [Phycisphaerae bacterium]